MRKFLLAMGVILFCSAPGLAQGVAPTTPNLTVAVAPTTPNLTVASEAEVVTPEVEVYAGYSYLRQYGENYNGGVGAVTYNVNRWFGITGDVSGYAPVDADDATGFAVAGPRFTYRRGPVTPFMHIMGGVAFGGSDAAGALIAGGGVDAKVSEHVAIRIFQADYIATTFRSNNGRISAGVVFRFGQRH